MAEREPFPQWWDVLWLVPYVLLLFWFLGSLANWLNGYGWGLVDG